MPLEVEKVSAATPLAPTDAPEPLSTPQLLPTGLAPLEARRASPLTTPRGGGFSLRPMIDGTLALRTQGCANIPFDALRSRYEVTHGNKVDLVVGGAAFFRQLADDIRAAPTFVHIVVYAIGGNENDRVTNELEALLHEKLAAGVEVRLKYEPLGSGNAFDVGPTSRMVARLRAAGAQVIGNNFYNPEADCGTPEPPRGPIEHRKLFVMDAPSGGLVAYTGGMNVQDRYRDDWHDVMVRVHGPAALQAQAEMLGDWMRMGGKLGAPGASEDELRARYFPEAEPPGDVDLQGQQGLPAVTNDIRDSLLRDIAASPDFVWIESPYVTDPKIRRALARAAKKGRDVRLLVPMRSDFPQVTTAMRGIVYSDLLRAGVRIFEYHGGTPDEPQMAHAKLFVTGLASSFGSYNLDGMSRKNTEMNYRSESPELRDRIKALIAADMERAREVPRNDVTPGERLFGLFLLPLVGPIL